jgi:hypothetical protein
MARVACGSGSRLRRLQPGAEFQPCTFVLVLGEARLSGSFQGIEPAQELADEVPTDEGWIGYRSDSCLTRRGGLKSPVSVRPVRGTALIT